MSEADLEANVAYLDAQLRLARTTLIDAYAQAALTGLLAGLCTRCEIAQPREEAAIVEEAFRIAVRAVARRDKLPEFPNLNPVSQPSERKTA